MYRVAVFLAIVLVVAVALIGCGGALVQTTVTSTSAAPTTAPATASTTASAA